MGEQSKLVLNPYVRVEISTDQSRRIAVSNSLAAHGERLLIEDAALVGWLFQFLDPLERSAAVESACSLFTLSEQRAGELLAALEESRVLIDESSSPPRESEIAWEEAGWRDALDFHLASADLSFEPDYDQYRSTMAVYLANAEVEGDPQPGLYKDVSPLETITLPSGRRHLEKVGLRDAYLHRRPFAGYGERAIDLPILAELLEHSFGKTGVSDKSILGPHLRKTSPSGGARHPTEVYVAIFDVSDVPAGLYHYSVRLHRLDLIKEGDHRRVVTDICFEKRAVRESSLVFFYAVRWQRHMWKYRYGRSYRMVVYDVGHLAQTQTLVAAALGLSTFSCPSFEDSKAGELLSLSDNLEEGILHVTAVGPEP